VTFTLAIKHEGWTVREALVSAIGCNFAWGIIDGTLYVLGCISERGRNLRALQAVRSSEPEKSHGVISAQLPPLIASVLTTADYETLRLKLKALPETNAASGVAKDDLLAGVGVFLMVFLSTFPVVIPFLLMKDVAGALSISNGIALILLFLTGFLFGRTTKSGAWRTGFITLALGSILTILALVLGG